MQGREGVVRVLTWGLLGGLVAAGGCAFPPRDAEVQLVARDAWDSACAGQAIIEKLKIDGRRWKDRSAGLYQVDIDATVKLVNDCHSEVTGKSYAQFQSVDFSFEGLELKKCEHEGEDGWMVNRPSARCITGPAPAGESVLPEKLPPPKPMGGTLVIPKKDGAKK